MKTLRKYLIIIVLSSITVQSFGQAAFYRDASGTYMDERSGEMVTMIFGIVGDTTLRLYYQVNERQTAQKSKMMEEQAVDVERRWLKVKFRNSNYICEFTFAPDFQTFICKNPNGRKQLFKRNPLPARVTFKEFLSHFPRRNWLNQSIDITKTPKNGKPIPVEFAIKFLARKDQQFYFGDPKQLEVFTTTAQKNDFKRVMILNSHLQDLMLNYIAFYYLARVSISNQFISLLFTTRGRYNLEAGFNDIYLANFSKSGELIDMQAISNASFSHYYSKTSAVGYIFRNKVKLEKTTLYNEYANQVAGHLGIVQTKAVKVLEYDLKPSGVIEHTRSFYKDLSGVYHNYDRRWFYVVRRVKGQLMAKDFYEDSDHFELEFVKFEPAINLLWMKSKKDGKVWKFQFNQAKTSVKITKSDGVSITLTR